MRGGARGGGRVVFRTNRDGQLCGADFFAKIVHGRFVLISYDTPAFLAFLAKIPHFIHVPHTFFPLSHCIEMSFISSPPPQPYKPPPLVSVSFPSVSSRLCSPSIYPPTTPTHTVPSPPKKPRNHRTHTARFLHGAEMKRPPAVGLHGKLRGSGGWI